MLAFLKKERKKNPGFAFSKDGVHPQLAGHALMAQLILKGIGVSIPDQDPQQFAVQLEQDSLSGKNWF